MFLVISRDEDEPHIHTFNTKEELIKYLNEDVMADGDLKPEITYTFLDKLPSSHALEGWPERTLLIIEGKIITPTPLNIVKSWQL